MKNSFFQYLTQRNKLTFRNVRTGEEFWHIFVNRLHIIGSIIGFLALIFVSILLIVAYTPILDLVPGNPGSRSRELLIDNIQRLDSLEREISLWEAYNSNLLVILEGGTPRAILDSIAVSKQKGTTIPRTAIDSLLRLRHLGDSSLYNNSKSIKQKEITFNMLPPSSGMIVGRFDPKTNNFGIVITPPPSGVILSIMDGTIVGSNWNPTDGQVITVQHASNMLSVYKQMDKALKQVGQRVKAGEPIAICQDIIGGQIPKLTFELWQNGNPVDPENYIAF